MVENATCDKKRGDNSSIFSIDLERKYTINTTRSVPFLDLHTEIKCEDWLRTTLCNKIDDFIFVCKKKTFEDTKGVIRSRKNRRTDNTMAKEKEQKDKQWYVKHYTDN